ncbi:hypothetical protein ACP275_08G186300 [Erythranthe tilingii]
MNESRLKELIAAPCSGVAVARFLDDIGPLLIELFQSLLTVEACHVAEVVSSLTDVPSTHILSYNTNQKEKAIYMMSKRLVNQEWVINEIFETLALQEKTITSRPRGLFLLLGFSGAGKTEIAKDFAQHWYCDASRLVEIDMSEYDLEPAACDSSKWSKRKHKKMWNRLAEIVGKRPYSVILLDKVDKASSIVTKILLRVLHGTTSDAKGNLVDFSKCIIFMTSSVGSDQLILSCTCYNRNQDLWEKYRSNPAEFFKNHDCIIKGSGCERLLVEVKKVFSSDLLYSLDKILVVENFQNLKSVMRLSLREIVREFTGERIVLQISDSAVHALSVITSPNYPFRKAVLEHIIPQLSSAEGHKKADVYIDTFIGTNELSFRFQSHEKDVDDWYFGQEAGTFDQLIANLRKKAKAVSMIFDLRSDLLNISDNSGQNPSMVQKLLHQLVQCNEMLTSSPLPIQPIEFACEKRISCNVVPGNLPTDEQKEKIVNACKRLQEIDSGIAKAASVIVDVFIKIIDAPFVSDNFPDKHFVFEGLDHDSKPGLVSCITDTIGDSFFTYVKLDTNSGEEVKNYLIEKVKETPCMVLLFDGVEFYDNVFYESLLQILDKGTLVDSEGLIVDFRRTTVILSSEAANKSRLADWFNYEHDVLINMAVNQNVNRYRTELFNWIDEMIIFDPLLPENRRILRFSKSDIRFSQLLFHVYWHREK